MPLPKIHTAEYELKLPSNGKTIKYRPFLVKEEKILILALETEDQKQITNAVKQVLKNCVITRGVKVENLPSFDIEYLFLNIRGKSIGESFNVVVTCPDDNETTVSQTIFVDEIEMVRPEGHNSDIKLDNDLTLRMKYPSMNQFIGKNFDTTMTPEESVEQSFDAICECMDTIFSAEEAWDASEYTKKEKMEFIEQLNSAQYKQIETFFATIPKLSYSFEVENPKTGVKSPIVLEGLTDFFG